ncbi:MAG: tripartite tricarboxylate transporter substrate binding protein BugD [Rhodospirillaceae bacterium]|nr:tripartite tricarboxylate transporter substrate binding protein BugD [Rhodospirillaceae bacterium]
MFKRLLASLAGAAFIGAVGAGLPAQAQDYPTGPITVVVPFSAGGPTDTVTRLVAESMSKSLGQQVIVENVGGAGGTLGAARVAKAEPDGYTLLLHHIGMATSATLYRKLPYDPKAAFAPIGLVTEVPMVLVARKDFPPNNLQELITYVKEHKDEVTYANAGIGAASHLCGMLFMQAIETPLTTVPYKGTGPAMTDLLGGQVDFLCDQTTNTTNQIKAGEVKAYGVFADQRLANLPDLPTVKEGGLEGQSFAIWHGLYAPAGTPEPIVNKLSEALKAALADQTVIDRFAELGTAPVPADQATPAALQQKVTSEIDRWKPVIEAAGEYAD